MMPLISGDVVSKRSDISVRKFSTEGQTFALKPKHMPVTAALTDDFSGKLVMVVHRYATLKCSVRLLRSPFVPVAVCTPEDRELCLILWLMRSR